MITTVQVQCSYCSITCVCSVLECEGDHGYRTGAATAVARGAGEGGGCSHEGEDVEEV